MKVIDEGVRDWKPWWDGRIVKCKACGRVVELEKGDNHKSNWMESGSNIVQFSCERCGEMIRIASSPNTSRQATLAAADKVSLKAVDG